MVVWELNQDRFYIVTELTSWATYAKSEMMKIMQLCCSDCVIAVHKLDSNLSVLLRFL